ncbi:MAG: hypothetical protein J6O60_08040, partial [Lachnospiraceae bacterium]|nr:hypothetical protein [Lachnospiraceae bacterium]
VRENVARNENAPTEALLTLKNDSEWRVAKLIVKNKSIPKDVLMELAKSANFRMRYKALVALLRFESAAVIL